MLFIIIYILGVPTGFENRLLDLQLDLEEEDKVIRGEQRLDFIGSQGLHVTHF